MIGKFDYNPLLEFYEALKNNIKMLIDKTYKSCYGNIDNIAKAVLSNNGCGFTDNACGNFKYIMDNSYGLYFIIGGTGNKANNYFDIIDFNGLTYLVIFLDEFEKMNDASQIDEDDPVGISAIEFMGKSSYYNIIIKIVNAFILMISNPAIFTSTFSTSSVANIYRFAPHIIAAAIINDTCGEVRENDVEGIDYNMIRYIIDNDKINLALYGIYKL